MITRNFLVARINMNSYSPAKRSSVLPGDCAWSRYSIGNICQSGYTTHAANLYASNMASFRPMVLTQTDVHFNVYEEEFSAGPTS